MFRLDEKTAVVTGSGSGIGRAVALLFAAQGATVHVVDLNEDACNATVMSIRASNGKAVAAVCDVTNQRQVKEVFSTIGKIDILVNSAGISHIGNVESTTEADFERVFNVNVKGVYNCLQAGVAIMKEA